MGKFNDKGIEKGLQKNLEGGVAYDRNNFRQDLLMLVFSSILNGDKFYETEKARIKRISESIYDFKDVEFYLKTMVYVRNTLGLRSVTHIMAVHASLNIKDNPLVRKAIAKTIRRADDAVEMLSYYNSLGIQKNVTNSLRRAFADSLVKFDKYQLKKYENANNKYKLRDVAKLSHPKGDFKDLIEGTLPNIDTVMTMMSDGKSSTDTISQLLNTGKLGYFAAIKNLRDSVSSLSLEDFNKLIEFLINDNKIATSMVMPYRFYTVWKEVKNIKMDRFRSQTLKAALEYAFLYQARNTDQLVSKDDSVAVILDESGSMAGDPFLHGSVLSSILVNTIKNNIFYLFANNCRHYSVSSNASPFDWIDGLVASGGGTNVYAPLEDLISTGTFVDKIVLFTDMQLYDTFRNMYGGIDTKKFKTLLDKYKTINPNVKLLFWNLQGYDTGTPVRLDDNILEVGGYSDKLLGVVAKIFDNPNALIEEINSVII